MIKRQPILALFVAAYTIGFGALAARNGNQEFVFYTLVMVAFIAGAILLDRRVRFASETLWGLAIWGLLHMAGGNLQVAGDVLYNYRPFSDLPRYDQVIHFYGFFSATLAAGECLRAAFPPQAWRVSTGVAIALACVGMGLGAVNEVIEFIATLIVEDTNVGDMTNTGWDLVANMLGACSAAAYLRARPSRASPAKGTEA